jgi:hypothetical protein
LGAEPTRPSSCSRRGAACSPTRKRGGPPRAPRNGGHFAPALDLTSCSLRARR